MYPDVFELMVDINHFGDYTAKEISIRVVETNWVEIHGRQQWRPHPGGTLRREFIQKLKIPHDCDTKKITANLTAENILTIRAPKSNPAYPLFLRPY